MSTLPFRADAGVQIASAAGSTIPASLAGLWWDGNVAGPLWRKADGTDLRLGSGGGSSTLATAYSSGASQTDSTIGLDSTRLGVRVRDNATPITGNLFAIQNSGGTSNYLAVTASLVSTVNQYAATINSVAQGQTYGVELLNSTAATSGAGNQQWSPGLQLSGQQYNGSASVQVDSLVQVRPNTGNTTAADLVFFSRYNGGSWVEQFSMRQVSSTAGELFGSNGSGGGSASAKLVLNDNTGSALVYGTSMVGVNWAITGINLTVSGSDVLYATSSQIRRVGVGDRFNMSASTKTTTYAMATTDYYIPTDTTSGAFTVTLPAPATAGGGATYVVYDATNKWATNNLTLARNASESIDGTAGNKVLNTANGRTVVWTDGTNWFTK